MNNYTIFGSKTVDIVIEMGLGACIAEWESLARELGKNHGVLVYERAGINHSDKSDEERTPTNIAEELKRLIDEIPHDEKIVIIGHSQGGMYASEFCGIYPEIVKGLILLDPLSIEDNRFKKELTARELKKSGTDKSKNFIILEMLTKLGLKGVVKKIMSQAPPFYYAGFSEEQKEDILNSLVNITHLSTCREEYRLAHEDNCSHFHRQPRLLASYIFFQTHSVQTHKKICILFSSPNCFPHKRYQTTHFSTCCLHHLKI